MATTSAENPGQPQPARRRVERKQTVLDSDVTKPQVTQPGDAPFDTTDETERATSVLPDFAAAAAAGHGTVNAVIPYVTPERIEEVRDGEERVEKYDAIGPDGKKVSVTRNIESGESRVG